MLCELKKYTNTHDQQDAHCHGEVNSCYMLTGWQSQENSDVKIDERKLRKRIKQHTKEHKLSLTKWFQRIRTNALQITSVAGKFNFIATCMTICLAL